MGPRVTDLERFKSLGEFAQGAGGAQALGWILPARCLRQRHLVAHVVNIG